MRWSPSNSPPVSRKRAPPRLGFASLHGTVHFIQQDGPRDRVHARSSFARTGGVRETAAHDARRSEAQRGRGLLSTAGGALAMRVATLL